MRKFNNKSGPHITTQLRGVTPPLEKCGTCCSLIHCPFCSPWIFKPTVLSKVLKHLEGHKKRAVQHKDHTIFKCNLECKDNAHFHCPSCKRLFDRRNRLLDHLVQCVRQGVEEAVEQDDTANPSASDEDIQSEQDDTENQVDSVGHTQVHKAPLNFGPLDDRMSLPYPHLPLSSLRLLVPPLKLMSACLWQVAQQRNVDQYGKLAEFIMLVTEMVPELLSYRQKTQLILGLRARLILEVLKKTDNVDCHVVQDHLDSFQQTTNHIQEEDQDEEVEVSKSAFVELVQTLLREQSEKEHFFKEVFSLQYGARFDTALQILAWEFFYRLEEFLPVPNFSQVSSMFSTSSLGYKFEQFVSDPEDLKRILQQQQERQKLTRSEFTFMSDTILSTLSSKQTLGASEDHIDQKMDGRGADGKEKTEKRTVKQEKSCHVEDDEETDQTIEMNPNSRLHENRLSSLTSSPCSEEAGAAGDDKTAGEDTFQPPRCSVEGIKEHLDQSKNKEPSEESMNQSVIGGGADDSENPRGADENTYLECGKTSASRSSLEKHHVVHSSVRPFKCTQCDKSYKSRKDLIQHVVIHSKFKVPPFACNLCKKRFNYLSSLTVHLRRHCGGRPFPCSHCNKRFLTSSVLKLHERIHTGEHPYACTLCDKKFTRPYSRTVHLRVHKKEKLHLCSTCGMSFCSSRALLVHLRAHTGKRPYQCDICGKRFAKSERLAVHQRFHTGERPYSCSQRDKSFQDRRNTQQHTQEKNLTSVSHVTKHFPKSPT